VMYRRGVVKRVKRFRLGSDRHHLVYEGEGIGLVLGLECLREELEVEGFMPMGVDCHAAIKATGLLRPAPSHHIFDMFHKRLDMVLRRHDGMELLIRWTPGHIDIAGNERADEEAKKAAQEGSSPHRELPAPLRKSLPRSKSAAIAAFNKKLTVSAHREWEKSPRYARIKDIDPTLPSPKFMKLIAPLPRKNAALLLQLRSRHIPLAAYLYRINKATSPTCPCCNHGDETVHHYLLECQAHRAARREMHRAGGRDTAQITKLLSKPGLLPHLFRFIGQTERFRSVFGEIPILDDD